MIPPPPANNADARMRPFPVQRNGRRGISYQQNPEQRTILACAPQRECVKHLFIGLIG